MNEPITEFTTRFLARFEEPPSNVVEFRGAPNPKPGTKIVNDEVVLSALTQLVKENALEEAARICESLAELWNSEVTGLPRTALLDAAKAIRARKDAE